MTKTWLILVAGLAVAAGADTTGQGADHRTPGMRLRPTAPGFGIAHEIHEPRPVRRLDLRCTDATLTNCIVAGMPLLWQMDPALQAPLAKYSRRYVARSGPNAGDIIWSEPQLSIGPTPYAPADFAQNIMSNGCYITSLTTLEAAALANAPAGVGPTARARVMAGIGANRLMPGSADVNRLQWQYRRWADKLQPNKADPSQPSSPDFLEMEEFAGDWPSSKGAYQDNPNPGGVTAAAMINGMKGGDTYLIAYQRYDIAQAPGGPPGVVRLTQTYDSHHKIAVSGFQPGRYPILINDVGNGKRYRARLTDDVRSIQFTESAGGAATVVGPAELRLEAPSGYPNPPPKPYLYIVYEGADRVAIGNGGQLFVIEDIETLNVGPQHRPILPRPTRGSNGGRNQQLLAPRS